MDSFSTFLKTLRESDEENQATEVFRTLFEKVDSLERQVRQQDRTIIGLQNELIKAGKYNHNNLETRVDGIQVLLVRAGEYRGRAQKGRRA
jgi:hypothetical protein